MLSFCISHWDIIKFELRVVAHCQWRSTIFFPLMFSYGFSIIHHYNSNNRLKNCENSPETKLLKEFRGRWGVTWTSWLMDGWMHEWMNEWMQEWMITYWQAKIGSCGGPFHETTRLFGWPFQTNGYVLYVTYVHHVTTSTKFNEGCIRSCSFQTLCWLPDRRND